LLRRLYLKYAATGKKANPREHAQAVPAGAEARAEDYFCFWRKDLSSILLVIFIDFTNLIALTTTLCFGIIFLID